MDQPLSVPHLYICAFSTPDYEPFNTIFSTSLRDTITAYKGTYEIRHEIYTIDGITTNEMTEFGSTTWQQVIKHKIKHIIHTLTQINLNQSDSIFIFSDCDIQYFKKNADGWNHLIHWFMNQTKPLGFMREAALEKLNSGFFMIKSSYYSVFIKTLKYVLEQLEIRTDLLYADQSILWELQDTLDLAFIPSEFIIYGQYPNNTALLHHAAGFPTRGDKIQLMEYVRNVVESDGTLALVKLTESI